MTGTETSRRYPGPNWASVCLAGVAAGPVFLLGLAIIAGIRQPTDIARSIRDLPSLLALLPVAIGFGTIIGSPVAALGGSIMFYFGMSNDIARSPVAWALAGAGSAGIPMLILTGGMNWPLPFAFTGAVVASICRWRTSWLT